MEIWDAYKADGSLAGIDLIRGEMIPEGLLHGVSEIFVLHDDGTILLTQRDYNKPNYPGLYESGAGGSILKGESFISGAIRELKEETGIKGKELTEIYSIVTCNTIYKGFLCIVNIDKNNIILQEGETISYQWISKKDFIGFYRSELFVPSLSDRLTTFVEEYIKVI